jgi:hypothetical protein
MKFGFLHSCHGDGVDHRILLIEFIPKTKKGDAGPRRINPARGLWTGIHKFRMDACVCAGPTFGMSRVSV